MIDLHRIAIAELFSPGFNLRNKTLQVFCGQSQRRPKKRCKESIATGDPMESEHEEREGAGRFVLILLFFFLPSLSLSLSLSFVCVSSLGGLKNHAALYFKCRQRETYGASDQLSGSVECGVDGCCMVCAKMSEAYLNLNDCHMNFLAESDLSV